VRDVNTRNDENGGQAQKSLVTGGLRWPVGRKNRPAPWLNGAVARGVNHPKSPSGVTSPSRGRQGKWVTNPQPLEPMPVLGSDGRSRTNTTWKNRYPGESSHLPCADSGVRLCCLDRTGCLPGEFRTDIMERDSRNHVPIRCDPRTVDVGGLSPTG
jgi:hypothetical protein